MTSSRSIALMALLAPSLLALAACGHSAPTRYLTLAAVPPTAPVAAGGDVGRLTLRPPGVRWPAALDRLEVMRAAGDVQLEADEVSRWSAAPGDLAAAALTQDLQARLPSLTLASPGAGPDALDLGVDVLAISRIGDGYRLTAVVTLSGGGGATRSQFVSVSTEESAQDAAAQAQATSRLIGKLADTIALDLATLSPAASGPTASRRPAP
jgi:uncharacterized lipoprotein YmbA